MLLLIIVVIIIALFFALAGVLLLTERLFKVKSLSYASTIKLYLLSQLILVLPIIGLILVPYLYTKKMHIGWGRAIAIFIVSTITGVLFVIPAATIAMNTFVFRSFNVAGGSMSPTLNNNDRIITSPTDRVIAGDNYVPKRGEIVVFHHQQTTLEYGVKRVIGLPGDRVVVKNGKIMIYNSSKPDGFNPDDGWGLAGANTLGNIDETVSASDVFVVGDNRAPQASSDSRDWGFLPTHDIISVLKYRIWPNFKSY